MRYLIFTRVENIPDKTYHKICHNSLETHRIEIKKARKKLHNIRTFKYKIRQNLMKSLAKH